MMSLSQKINADVVRIYEQRRNQAFYLREERVKRIYDQYPVLESLDRELRTAGLEQLQSSLDCVASQGIDGRSKSLAQVLCERTDFLAEHGIADGYSNLAHTCRACRDTGRIDGGWCYCRRLIVQRILPDYFPDPMSDDAVFANFNLNVFDSKPPVKGKEASARDTMADYLQMAQFYSGNFDRVRDRNLFFSGAPGTGKTFLMQCIGHRLMDEGKSVVYITAPNLFDLITRYKRQLLAYRPDPEMLEEVTMLHNALLTWDLLLLDDLGTEPATPETYSNLMMLLDSRQNRNLATVIASNLASRDFTKQYDSRVASRLRGNFLVYRFPGDDLRLRAKHCDN
ncbi:MAG: ATP-binding protein [Clostridiaceae bacterium]|nr:ATP-binding protein [Clostridiaceae bacterium]